ncbi:uncharacterized protein TNCV_1310111 [Trichonephila clavipes]|nr:uncharacterized protein TNCV_1310111 [Trichonephila clavipes]
MSTPLKLNVTFWDMPEKPNNGYGKNLGLVYKKRLFDSLSKYFDPLLVKIGIALAAFFAAWFLNVTRMAGTVLPFFAVAGVHFWHSIIYRNRLTPQMSHGMLCVNVLAEIAGGSLSPGFGVWTLIHSVILCLTGLIIGQKATLTLYAGCRLFLWSCLPWIPDSSRTVMCYTSIILGTIAAKYMEAFLITQVLSEMKLSTPRRRRTSNNTIYSIYKMRRTSLPALGGSNKTVHPSLGYQVSVI